MQANWEELRYQSEEWDARDVTKVFGETALSIPEIQQTADFQMLCQSAGSAQHAKTTKDAAQDSQIQAISWKKGSAVSRIERRLLE